MSGAVIHPLGLHSVYTMHRIGTVQPEEEAQRDLINVRIHLKERCHEDRARLVSVVPSARTWGNAHTGGSIWTPEALLCCAGDRALAQAAQSGCGISLGMVKTHLDMALDPALVGPARAGVGPDGLQRSLPTPAVLWVCENALVGNTVNKRFSNDAGKSHFIAFFSFLLVILLACFSSVIQSALTSLQRSVTLHRYLGQLWFWLSDGLKVPLP